MAENASRLAAREIQFRVISGCGQVTYVRCTHAPDPSGRSLARALERDFGYTRTHARARVLIASGHDVTSTYT